MKPKGGGVKATLADLAEGTAELEKYKDYIIFEEYTVKPESYVLNGTLFAMIGLYDWSQVTDSVTKEKVTAAFNMEIKTLEIILPYYDYNGYSSYDLLPYTSDYEPVLTSIYAHTAHIYLLDALCQITDNRKIYQYCELFKEYTDNEFYHQTEQLLQ